MRKSYRSATVSFGMTLMSASYIGHLFFLTPFSQGWETNKLNKILNNKKIYLVKRPVPPDRGTPQGEPTPGGTRPQTSCRETPSPVTALVANKGRDFTLSSHPTFWFYIPYTAKEVRYIEFALLNPQQQKTVYRTAIEIKNPPGMIKIAIPPEQQYAIELFKNYRWNLMLYCSGNQTDEPDVSLNGWVQRVSADSEENPKREAVGANSYQAYLDSEIWYDAINAIAQHYFENPNNPEFNSAWLKLLQLLGNEELQYEKLTDSIPIRAN